MRSKTLATKQSPSLKDADDTTTSCTAAIADGLEWMHTSSNETEPGYYLESLVEVDEREIEPADFIFDSREDDEWEEHHDSHGDPGDGLGLEDNEWGTESHDSAFFMHEMYGTQAGL
jgi:hypothetical protein